MDDIDMNIANIARAINRQISDLADAKARQTRNVVITDTGEVFEIENHLRLQQIVEDRQHVLDDMLRMMDKLIKEQEDE